MNTSNDTPQDFDADDDTGNSFTTTTSKGQPKLTDKESMMQDAYAIIRATTLLSRNKAGQCHVTFTDGDGFETMVLGTASSNRRIKRTIFRETKKRFSAQPIADLTDQLYDDADDPATECHEVGNRVALGAKKQIYIDLGNAQRDILEVNSTGYHIFNSAERIPLFFRPTGMTALPNPVGQVENLELLRKFVNVPNEGAWKLLVVFMLFCYRPNGPYVILIVTGMAGSSKSTMCRVIRRLIDPSSADKQYMPKNAEDLMITATKSHLLVIDNVRKLSHELSDLFCCIATGTAIRKRGLFSDSDEVLLHAINPIILNGISGVADQPDLVSRCVHIELEKITVRQTEEEFNRSFDASIGSIFAGLMGALSKTLAALPTVTDAPEARMADFEHFGIAVELALDWPQGSFKAAYVQNQREQMESAMGDDPLAQAVTRLANFHLEEGDTYTKAPAILLKELRAFATPAQLSSKSWPPAANSLSRRLKTLEPALRACLIGVEFHKSGPRSITLSRLEG